MPQILPSEEAGESLTHASCDALLLGAFSSAGSFELDETGRRIDAALDSALSRYLENSDFKGKASSIATLPTLGRIPARTVVVAGLGPRSSVTTTEVRKAAGNAVRRVANEGILISALHLAVPGDDAASASVEGLLLGSYRFNRYKSEPEQSSISEIRLPQASAHAVDRGRIYAEAAALARDLANEPPAALTPKLLARRAEDVARSGDLECTVYDAARLQGEGFGGILGVGRGSSEEPVFIVLRYTPPNPRGRVAIVGKGVTFDSGGLSLKEAKSMETMKTDMSGAAAVIGVMSALPKLAPGIEVLGLAPAAENMPGPGAIKPGDVIRHYGGKTTEVLNTDAEGRLILADALSYAAEQEPDAIVDIATLTGSILVALGRKLSGLFSNDDALRDELVAASKRAGEPVWPMPLYEDYRSELESPVADRKNIGSRYAGATTAALFLESFVTNGIPWAHLDIVGPARADNDQDEIRRGATGAHTRTLLEWIEARAR